MTGRVGKYQKLLSLKTFACPYDPCAMSATMVNALIDYLFINYIATGREARASLPQHGSLSPHPCNRGSPRFRRNFIYSDLRFSHPRHFGHCF